MEKPQRKIILQQSNIFHGQSSFVNHKEAVEKNKSFGVLGDHLIF